MAEKRRVVLQTGKESFWVVERNAENSMNMVLEPQCRIAGMTGTPVTASEYVCT